MLPRVVPVCFLVTLLNPISAVGASDDPPPMKFNDVREVAPGVFFRYSAISATDKSVAFGGSNNIWVVFKDYVVVIDANFPKEAGDVIEAIKKTTDKPIRYVLDSHHHGDHAYGNAVFSKAGGEIVAQANCFRLLRDAGAEEFSKAGRGPGGRKDVAESSLKVPDVIFDDKLVLDDGTQRVEFLFLGHAHTAGDAFAYLPKHKLLCTGDACVNGAFNYMGHSDSASWIRVLDRAQKLDVKWVLPGHGPVAGKDLLETQKRYVVDLRKQVQDGVAAGKTLSDIVAGINMPWYKGWTGVTPPGDNIRHVFSELTGDLTPWDLVEEYGVYEGNSSTKQTLGWSPPRRIVVPNLMPARLAELKRVAPALEFIPVKSEEEASKAVEDADAVVGFSSAEVLRAGKTLRWVQAISLDDASASAQTPATAAVITDSNRIRGPGTVKKAFALLLALASGTQAVVPTEIENEDFLKPDGRLSAFRGKTILVIGVGGIGTGISAQARALGMRILVVDPKQPQQPSFVYQLDKTPSLMESLPQADVVVLACPEHEGKRLLGDSELSVMKPTAYLINVGRPSAIDTPALEVAIEADKLAGAGLDASFLTKDHKLRQLRKVLVASDLDLRSAGASDRQWRLWRDNVRRFAAGQKLLCVIEKPGVQ
jgi:phosphoglycerate dehydrogenase-like enzyme/glyoxylase-like metal-dependent hydrolase (beta-lactamase superfamily II)